MFADSYFDDLDFNHPRRTAPRRKNHFLLAALMFLAAYFTTITVQAQEDNISLGANKMASITGTVKEADENWVIVTTAGKDMKIVLDEVHLQGEADTIFTRGMTVTADGTMSGDDFGMPLMTAKVITATSPATGANP